MKTIRFAALLAGLAFTMFAADIDGAWKATFTTPDGQTRENTITLKADGENLTGTISSRIGDAKIQDGKIKGDEVSFTAVRNINGDDLTFKYTGKVTGNKMTLHVTAGDRDFEMTAVKQ